MALDTLRAALRPPSDVPLDRAGRRLLRRRDRAVRAELYHWRRDRRLHPGLAADRGGPVCTVDHVPADCRIKVCVMEMWKTAACADGKPIHSTWKRTGLSHILQTGFPQRRRDRQFTHIPTTPAATIITATVLSSLNQVNKKRECQTRFEPKKHSQITIIQNIKIIANPFAALPSLSLQVSLAYTFLQQFDDLYTHLLMPV